MSRVTGVNMVEPRRGGQGMSGGGNGNGGGRGKELLIPGSPSFPEPLD